MTVPPPDQPNQPHQPPMPSWAPAPSPARGVRLPLVAAIVAGAVVVAGGTGGLVGYALAGASTATAAPTAVPSTTEPVFPSDPPAITPGPITPTYSPTPSETPTPTQTPQSCKTYKKISDRQFKKLSRDATPHIGECYRIHGYVTQSDSSTGTTSFRANTCGEKKQPQYGYISDCDNNAILMDFTGELIADIVQDDAFTADVTVGPPLTYDTTIGGQATALTFYVQKISKYATVK